MARDNSRLTPCIGGGRFCRPWIMVLYKSQTREEKEGKDRVPSGQA